MISETFADLLKLSMKYLDFETIQKVILYGNSYFMIGENKKKRTVLDEIKRDKVLGDLSFWKFYLLWLIRSAISDCKVTEERSLHIRNGVYTTLLSNSLSMIDWGL